jgi:serine/threonine protein kinase
LKSINYSWTQSPKALENLNTLEDMFLETPPSMHEDIAAFWNGLFDTIWALELLYSPVNESKVHHFDIKPSNILVHHQINASPRKFGISDVDISKFGIFEGMESIIEEPEPDKADHDRESSNADNWGEGVTDDESCQMCHFHRNISPAYVKGNIDIWSLGYVFSEAARWLVLGYRGLESHRRHRIPKPGCPLDLRNLQEASNSESKYDSATYASTKAFLRVLGEEADPITKIICDEIIPGMFEHSDGMTGLAGIWRTAKGVTKGAPRSLDGLSQTHEKVGATTSDPLQGTIPHDDDTRSKTRSNSGDFLYRFQNATGVSKKGTRKAWPRLNGLTQTATKSKANTTSHRPRSTGLIWSKQPIERFIREERDYRSRAVEAYDSHQQAAKYLHIERLRQCMQAID